MINITLTGLYAHYFGEERDEVTEALTGLDIRDDKTIMNNLLQDDDVTNTLHTGERSSSINIRQRGSGHLNTVPEGDEL